MSNQVVDTIEINAAAAAVFDVSNDLERWPRLMSEYRSVKISHREGHKVWFDIERTDGSAWRSWRVLRPDLLFAYAERHAPLEPFKYMHILWSYKELGESRSLMTWDMEFELAAESGDTASWLHRFREHTRANMAAMKCWIEKLETE